MLIERAASWRSPSGSRRYTRSVIRSSQVSHSPIRQHGKHSRRPGPQRPARRSSTTSGTLSSGSEPRPPPRAVIRLLPPRPTVRSGRAAPSADRSEFAGNQRRCLGSSPATRTLPSVKIQTAPAARPHSNLFSVSPHHPNPLPPSATHMSRSNGRFRGGQSRPSASEETTCRRRARSHSAITSSCMKVDQ